MTFVSTKLDSVLHSVTARHAPSDLDFPDHCDRAQSRHFIAPPILISTPGRLRPIPKARRAIIMDHHIPDNTSEAAESQRQSRATSPGGIWRETQSGKVLEVNGINALDGARGDEYFDREGQIRRPKPARYRPRTFPYQRYLPYPHDDRKTENIEQCIKRLYIAISAGDFVPGATHWTREIRGWIQLKFDLPREDRVKLVKLYYELALAPGMDSSAADRFAGMFMTLTKYVLVMRFCPSRSAYLGSQEKALYSCWRRSLSRLETLV